MAVLEPPLGATFGLDKVQIIGKKLTHGGQVAEHIQMVLYAKTANLGHSAPPLERCAFHCCRPNTAVPVEQVNLRHARATASCSGTNPKDAFPELVGAGAGPAGAPAPTAAASTIPLRKLTRLSE
jgi:hypothetical protein